MSFTIWVYNLLKSRDQIHLVNVGYRVPPFILQASILEPISFQAPSAAFWK